MNEPGALEYLLVLTLAVFALVGCAALFGALGQAAERRLKPAIGQDAAMVATFLAFPLLTFGPPLLALLAAGRSAALAVAALVAVCLAAFGAYRLISRRL